MWRVLLATALTLQCGLESIELDGKRCPCREGSGYVCDTSAMICVLDDNPCEPVVSAADVRIAWATPNVIRWEWEPSGAGEDFVRYEIRVWEEGSPEEVRVISDDENPELGGYLLPRTVSPNPVRATMTFDHEPSTTYVGRLIIVDSALCEFRSPVVAVTTPIDAPDAIPLFEDDAPAGLTPAAFTAVSDGDGLVLEYRSEVDETCDEEEAAVCSQNLTIRGLNQSLARLTPAQFGSAFLELVLEYTGRTPSYYSRVWLGFNAGCAPDPTNYQLTPFTLAAGTRTMQVPLRALRQDDDDAEPALVHADATMVPVCRVNVGGQFARTALDDTHTRIRVDDVRIRF